MLCGGVYYTYLLSHLPFYSILYIYINLQTLLYIVISSETQRSCHQKSGHASRREARWVMHGPAMLAMLQAPAPPVHRLLFSTRLRPHHARRHVRCHHTSTLTCCLYIHRPTAVAPERNVQSTVYTQLTREAESASDLASFNLGRSQLGA